MRKSTVPVAKAPPDAITDIRVFGLGKRLFLFLQWLAAAFGATILVPILVNSDFGGNTYFSVQLALMTAGLGTLLFHAMTKGQVPAFLGSSFAFLAGYATVAHLDVGIFADMPLAEKLPYASGGIVVAGALYFVLALLILILGSDTVMKFLPPSVTSPIVVCIGFGLIPSTSSNMEKNWPIAVITMVLLGSMMLSKPVLQGVNSSRAKRGLAPRPIPKFVDNISLIPILLTIVIVYIIAYLMHIGGLTNADGSAIIDTSAAHTAAWVGLPEFKWAKFDWTVILIMAPIAISTMMEHIGDITAISNETGKNFIKHPGLFFTLIADGLATALAAMFGSTANTTYGETTAAMSMTKIHDPRVPRGAAVLAVLLGLLPKVSSFIGSLPAAIIGGVSFVLYFNISLIGFKNMKAKVDFSRMRDTAIVGLVFGVFMLVKFTTEPSPEELALFPHVLQGDGNLTFGEFKLSALAAASIVGILLNIIIPGRDENPTVDDTIDDENAEPDEADSVA